MSSVLKREEVNDLARAAVKNFRDLLPMLNGYAQVLTGKSVSEEQAKAAADAALKNARPLSQNAYKVQLARVAVKRAIMKAAGGAA